MCHSISGFMIGNQISHISAISLHHGMPHKWRDTISSCSRSRGRRRQARRSLTFHAHEVKEIFRNHVTIFALFHFLSCKFCLTPSIGVRCWGIRFLRVLFEMSFSPAAPLLRQPFNVCSIFAKLNPLECRPVSTDVRCLRTAQYFAQYGPHFRTHLQGGRLLVGVKFTLEGQS